MENPLSTKVLQGEFKEGDTIAVDLVDDALTFTIKANKKNGSVSGKAFHCSRLNISSLLA